MSDVRKQILDDMASALGTITGVRRSTRFINVESQEGLTPYIGVRAVDEFTQVEDATDIRFVLTVELFVITEERYQDVEGLITKIKNKIYSPISLGSHCHVVDLVSVLNTQVPDKTVPGGDKFSTTVMNLTVIYSAPKSGF